MSKVGRKTEKKEEKLSPRRELFCQLYISNDVEMFGNGVQSYIEAYNPDTSQKNWYKTACASASRMLSNVKVTERINELLERQGFNDENVEKQHLFILNQHVNIPAKMKAIEGYYKLKGKNATEKLDITSKGDKVTGFNFESNGDNNKTNDKTGDSLEASS